MIIVESIRKKKETLKKKYPTAILADVTSKATDRLIELSPFYPHGDIPIPYSECYTASAVEVIWQGLKVFKSADVYINIFYNTTMKHIQRTPTRFRPTLVHRTLVFWSQL